VLCFSLLTNSPFSLISIVCSSLGLAQQALYTPILGLAQQASPTLPQYFYFGQATFIRKPCDECGTTVRWWPAPGGQLGPVWESVSGRVWDRGYPPRGAVGVSWREDRDAKNAVASSFAQC